MGVERFQDGDEDPNQKADAGLSKDTDHRGDPTPDNSPGKSAEMADAEVKRAESRTRSEYADDATPAGSLPIEEDSPKPVTEEPSHSEHPDAMPSGHEQPHRSHSAEEPDKQRAEEHWNKVQLDTRNDSPASTPEQRSPADATAESAQDDSGRTTPSDEREEPHGDRETEPGLDKESDADAVDEPEAGESSALGNLDSPASDGPSTQEPDRGTDLEQEVTRSPGPSGESLAEGSAATDNTDQETSEIDERTRPLTDKEWAEHLTEVRNELEKAHAEGLATDHKYTIDPDRLRWNRERRELHREIVETIYTRSENVPCNRSAIMAGGLGGAGKTTILKEQVNVDLTKYLMINPDDIKEEMARRGLVPEIEGLSPMESSDLVHEESSAIAKSLARRAYSEGRNLIWDITMSSSESTNRRVRDMREAGYTSIDGIFVDIPIDTSVRRIGARHRLGHDEFRAGHGLGGRFVPSEVIRAQADNDWGSLNRRTFESVKESFDSWHRYDNSIDGQPATLAEASVRKQM